MKTLIENAYAKINLYLEVSDKRDDGYHNLKSVMQSVSLCDTITVSVCEADKNLFDITCSDMTVPCGMKNTAYKAASAFTEYFGLNKISVCADIYKRIPCAAGLAGGSADAAAVIRALNSLCEINADTDELCRLGATIGADVPFCIRCGTMFCEGIGEIMTPIETSSSYTILLAIPGEAVSTKLAFNEIDKLPHRSGNCDAVVSSLRSGKLPSELFNGFEDAILPIRPNAARLKKLLESTADTVLMSGSGPTIFALYSDRNNAKADSERLNAIGYPTIICNPLYI